MFVNSSKSGVWDSGIHLSDRDCPPGDAGGGLWFLSAFSFVARANEILNGHWMDDQLAEKSDTFPRTLVASKTLLELDLDYLERRGGDGYEPEVTSGGSASKEEDSPADSLERVKVVFLGAPGVGKSSIIRQFVWSEFSEEYRPTDRRETYYPSVVLAERLYELKITDLPTIPYFPVSSHLEWTDFRYYGLRSATAYVLVFDLSNQDTFQYIRTLREQIYEARDMRSVPLLVVGNKQDKLPSTVASSSRHRDIVNLVRKHWRCGYVECSARFNCRVVQVFRELMKSIQAVEGKPSSPTPTSSLQPLMRGASSAGQTPESGSAAAGAAGASGQAGNSEKCILL
ncbi:ras-related protein Rap-1b isoform X2 [Nasonia vitripennis]|uniref:Ras-like protein family member 10B n=1 Tax=Nasonia vitripennis TaxID=7425 RepID=A0A7M7IX74_NASVI|nr:ras-related protein Rap-1b isoform X2 [Nasonia vitripennis]